MTCDLLSNPRVHVRLHHSTHLQAHLLPRPCHRITAETRNTEPGTWILEPTWTTVGQLFI